MNVNLDTQFRLLDRFVILSELGFNKHYWLDDDQRWQLTFVKNLPTEWHEQGKIQGYLPAEIVSMSDAEFSEILEWHYN
jgi:hypothetical protein